MPDDAEGYPGKKDKVAVYLEEFKSYRVEIIANQDGYIKIVTVGAAAAGALLVTVFGTNTLQEARGIIAILAAFIFFASAIVAIRQYYHTEVIAGYVEELEQRINELAATNMNWESERKNAIKLSLKRKLLPWFYP